MVTTVAGKTPLGARPSKLSVFAARRAKEATGRPPEVVSNHNPREMIAALAREHRIRLTDRLEKIS